MESIQIKQDLQSTQHSSLFCAPKITGMLMFFSFLSFFIFMEMIMFSLAFFFRKTFYEMRLKTKFYN